MRDKSRAAAGWLALSALALPAFSQRPARCVVGTLEGEVRTGESYVRPIGGGLELMLEPLASGWIVRVLPAGRPRPPHDYAELATPPYHSVSPLLIGTDFSFRAQDAVGWNPRRFHYAPDEASFGGLLKAYEAYEAKGGPSPSSQQTLAELVGRMPQAALTILDARLIPGTADQAGTAAVVASHFGVTAHTIEASTDGKTTALGRITWLRFRVALELPKELRPDRGLAVKLEPCDRP